MPIEESVLEVLDLPAIQTINFVWEGFAITPAMYERVAEYIRIGRILVTGGTVPIPAYEYGEDTLHYTFTEATNWAQKAAIVHEATHAACDLAQYTTMNVGDSECMAYMAQCVAGRQLCGNPNVDILVGTEPAEGEVSTVAFANAIFSHGWTLGGAVEASAGYRFDGEFAQAFRTDVGAHPWYTAHMTSNAHYLGVLRPSRAEAAAAARIVEHIRPRSAGHRPSCTRSYGLEQDEARGGKPSL